MVIGLELTIFHGITSSSLSDSIVRSTQLLFCEAEPRNASLPTAGEDIVQVRPAATKRQDERQDQESNVICMGKHQKSEIKIRRPCRVMYQIERGVITGEMRSLIRPEPIINMTFTDPYYGADYRKQNSLWCHIDRDRRWQ